MAAGLSQRQLGDVASDRNSWEGGASFSYLSRIEGGTRTPSGKALRQLAPILGVTPHYLESGNPLSECPHCGHRPERKDFTEGFLQGWERAWAEAQEEIRKQIEKLLRRT